MLKIENLSTSYKTIDGYVHVLKDINFEIKDNEIFGIAGESGCGKTTLLNTLYDIVDYPLVIDQGRVVLEGEKDGKKYSFESGKIRDTWWNNIAYVPQAAQSVLNPIVRLKTQFLDSIPKDQKKNEKPEETFPGCSGVISIPAVRWYETACDHCTGNLYVSGCCSGR